MIKKIWVILSFILVFSFIFSFENISLANPVNSGANGEIFLEKLPGLEVIDKDDFDSKSGEQLKFYVNWIIQTSVILGSMLAVAFIIYGGITYMTTDSFSGKTEGREHVTNALGGLIFLIGGYLIFIQINPNILNIDFSTASGRVTIEASDIEITFEMQEAVKSSDNYISYLEGNKGQNGIESTADSTLCNFNVRKVVMPNANNGNISPRCIVLHRTASGNINLSRMKSEGLGTQLWVAKNGDIVQVNDIENKTWHVAHQKKGYERFSNSNCVGIEVTGFWKGSSDSGFFETPTSSQINSIKKISSCLMSRYNFSQNDIYYHGAISTNKKPNEGKLVYQSI